MAERGPSARRTTRAVREEKYAAIESMLRVVEAEEYKLLTNYMYLSRGDMRAYIDITENGEYVLTVRAVTDRLIDIGRVL